MGPCRHGLRTRSILKAAEWIEHLPHTGGTPGGAPRAPIAVSSVGQGSRPNRASKTNTAGVAIHFERKSKMPIRAEIRHLYGAAHRRLRAELIALLGDACQKVQASALAAQSRALDARPHEYEAGTILCPSCHAKYDARQRHAMTRRTIAKRRGQLWLTDAIEWAPFPSLGDSRASPRFRDPAVNFSRRTERRGEQPSFR
jgi:hypothetical protein